MPIYEYKCVECGQIMEVLVRHSDMVSGKHDEEALVCTKSECAGRVRRTLSHTSFVLKGGGWASDGYSG
jgi:putative FmdB family regulatory protein